MIGKNELGLMKTTALLVNSSRAAVVTEAALLEVLTEGAIAGAALDVFWEEPLPEDSPWKALENVLITPHIGGASDDVKRHQGQMLIEDLQCLGRGEVPDRLANPEVLALS